MLLYGTYAASFTLPSFMAAAGLSALSAIDIVAVAVRSIDDDIIMVEVMMML